jgi:large subunit ribosomal protein L1
MGKLTKKGKLISEKVSPEKLYSVTEAVGLLTEFASGNFKESLEVSVNLGIDARKSDQAVRGSTVLPSGTGKEVRVAVFAQGENAEKAKSAGADLVGFDDLAESIQGGNLDFDVVIATPDAMRVVGKLGTVLGPRGLMPNPKVGTVTPDVETAVKNAKGGQVRYRTDKNGIVHGGIGKVGFDATAVQANLEALLLDLKKIQTSFLKRRLHTKGGFVFYHGPGLADRSLGACDIRV